MDTTFATWVNSLGLFLDIVGVALIWNFGLPEPLSRTGAIHLILEHSDDAEARKATRYDRLSHLGLGLALMGFVLQLASNFIRF